LTNDRTATRRSISAMSWKATPSKNTRNQICGVLEAVGGTKIKGKCPQKKTTMIASPSSNELRKREKRDPKKAVLNGGALCARKQRQKVSSPGQSRGRASEQEGEVAESKRGGVGTGWVR